MEQTTTELWNTEVIYMHKYKKPVQEIHIRWIILLKYEFEFLTLRVQNVFQQDENSISQ